MNGTISVTELQQLAARRSDAQLVDVRTASEYAAGHVPGAVNIPMEQIEARLADFGAGAVVLICQSGARACLTANLLQASRSDVSVLEGGTNAWAKAGFPLVVNARTRWALERQVRLVAGLLALAGAVIALEVSRYGAYLAGFIGLGLTFAGLTDICPMASFLCRMPWNRSRRRPPVQSGAPGQTCSLRNLSSVQGDGETIVS